MNKKGSLNLSIEVIIIIVIAFVVLGLGLSFVRGQFKSITETSSGVQEQIRQQILEDLRTGDKKLSFPATTLTIEKGDSQDIAIGVKNRKNGDLKFQIIVNAIQAQSDASKTDFSNDVTFFYAKDKVFTLKTTEADAYSIKINAKGDTDTYLISLNIIDTENTGEPIYAEKTFFVNII